MARDTALMPGQVPERAAAGYERPRERDGRAAAGYEREREAFRGGLLRPLRAGEAGQLEWPQPSMLFPEAGTTFREQAVNPDAHEQSRRAWIRSLGAIYDQGWETDPRFDDLVAILDSATRDSPELRQLMLDGWTAAASVAYTDFFRRASGDDLGDPITFTSRLIETGREMLAREDVAFLSYGQWLRSGRFDAEFQVQLTDRAVQESYRQVQQATGMPDWVRSFRSGENTMMLPAIPSGLAHPMQVWAGEGRMVVNIPTDRGEPQWVDMALAPGSRVETPAQALTVLVESALLGRHQILQAPDSLKGPQNWTGVAWEAVGDVLKRAPVKLWDNILSAPHNYLWELTRRTADWMLGDRPFEMPGLSYHRSEATVGWQQELAEREQAGDMGAQLERARLADPETAVVALGQDMYAAGWFATPGESLAAAAPLLEQADAAAAFGFSREGWEADRMDAARVDAELAASETQARGLQGILEGGFNWLVNLLDLENSIASTEGVRFVDTLGDLAQAAAGLLGLPVDGVEPIWRTGSIPETFKSAWDPFVQGMPIPGMDQDYQYTRPSEYFQFENPFLAFGADLSALALCPTNWLFAGAGRAARNFHQMFSTREGVEQILSLQSMRHTAFQVSEYARQARGVPPAAVTWRRGAATGIRNPIGQIQRLTNGMDPRLQIRLMNTETMEDVIDVFREALPGGGGTWIPNLFGHHMIRNMAQQVRWLSGLSVGTGKRAEAVRQFLRRSIGGFSRDRGLSVSPFMGPTEYADQVAYLIPDAARADELLLSFYDDLARAQQQVTITRDLANTQLTAAYRDLAAVRRIAPAEAKALKSGTWAGRIRPAGAEYTVEELAEHTAQAERRISDLEEAIRMVPRRYTDPAEISRRTAALQAEIDAIRSGRWTELQRLHQDLRRIESTTVIHPERATAGRPLRTAEQHAAVRAGLEQIGRLRGQPMMRGLASADETMRQMVAAEGKWLEDVRAALHTVEEAKALASRAVLPDTRMRMAVAYEELWEEVGERLGLEQIPGRVNPLTGKPVYNWEPVTGRADWAGGLTEDVPRLGPLTIGPEGTASGEALSAAGYFRNLAHWQAPASPMQVAAYEAIGAEGMRGILSRTMGRIMLGQAEHASGQAVLGALDAGNRSFLTVLLHPKIMFRSGIDEPLRYMVGSGRVMGGERAVGLTAEGALQTARRPGSLYGSVRQFTPGFEKAMRLPEESIWAGREEFLANWSHPTQGLSSAEWQMVGQKAGQLGTWQVIGNPRLHRDAVVRWSHGMGWMGDDAARAISRSIADTARRDGTSIWHVIEQVEPSDWDLTAWSAYWQDKGRFYRQTLKVGPEGAEMAGMTDGAFAFRNGLRVLGGNATRPAEVVDDLIRRTVDSRHFDITADADQAIIRMWGPMPSDAVGASARGGSLPQRIAGVQDWLLQRMYGVPGENRWGMFHADYYDQALRTLADGNQGRIMTPGRLARLAREGKIDLGYPGMEPEQAALLYWDSHLEIIDDIAWQQGLVTPHMLRNVANRYATQQALHLMYQPGATSMLGKVLQKTLWNFGPAQFDYVSWWASEMTKATFVGMFGQYMQVPNFLNFKAMINGQPWGALPLNLRLMANATNLGGLMAHQVKEPYWEPGDALSMLSPFNLVEEFTFLPRLDSLQNFLLSISPAMGPWSSMAIRMLPDPDGAEPGSWLANAGQEIRRFVETLNPGVEWASSVGRGWDGFLESAGDAFFPKYQGSFRDLIGFMFDTIGSAISDPGAALRGQFRSTSTVGVNPYTRVAFDSTLANALRDMTGQPPLVVGLDAFSRFADDVIGEAETLAWREDAYDTLASSFPVGGLLYQPADLPTPMWSVMVEELPALVDAGLLGRNTAGNLQNAWQAYEDGTLDGTETYQLRQSLRDVLINLPNLGAVAESLQARLILRHPELQMPLVGRYTCTVDDYGEYKAPEGSCTRSGSPSYPEAAGMDAIFDFISHGMEQHWFREVSYTDRIHRVMYGLRQAQGRVLRDVYMGVTGRSSYDAGRDIRERDETWFAITDTVREDLALCGYHDELPDLMLGRDFAALIDTLRSQTNMRSPYGSDPAGWSRLEESEEGRQAADYLEGPVAEYTEEMAFDSGADWAERDREQIREQVFRPLIEKDLLSSREYNLYFRREWGPLDWAEMRPEPPAMQDLEEDVRILRLQPDNVFVIDGDTVDVMFADGETSRFRLVGVNAPDDPMPGWEQAYTDLVDLLHHEGYEDIALVFWNLDRFGWQAGTDFRTGKPRWKAWLYVDGQPIYNPDVFTPSEPLGIAPGSTFTPLPRPQLAAQEEQI